MKNVLIVDDSMLMRRMTRQILEKNKYTVAGEAENGMNALVKYQELKPDVVTMDITMPEMSGLEAIKLLKRMDPNAKVVMISAMGQESMVAEAIVSGAKGFLVKPYREEDLLKALRSL